MGKDFKEILEEVWPDYVLGRGLGQGSFAAVYEAHRRDGVAVSPSAIKVISVPTSENEVEELRMEGLTGDRTQEDFQSVVDDYKREIKLMDVLKTDPHVVNIEDYKVCKVPDEMLWYIFIRMPMLTPLRTEMEKWTKDELEDKAVFYEIKRQVDKISVGVLKQKAEVMLRATGAFKDYEIKYEGLSIKEM